jgi:hypothetical protein
MEIELLYDKIGGPYVEFNMWGNSHWHECSTFLEEPVYWLFANYFERVSCDFNYYGPTLFTHDELTELRFLLAENGTRYKEIKTLSQFTELVSESILGVNFINELDREHHGWRDSFEEIRDKLSAVNKGLLSIVDKCLVKQRVLWVLGI